MKLRHGFLLGLFAFASVLPAKEPVNLAVRKDEIQAYIDSGEYLRDVATVAKEAETWLEQRTRRDGEKPAIVLDLDETLISNLPELVRENFGSDRTAMAAWHEQAICPVIAPVRDVYQVARRLNLHVIFLTGRRETHREATLRNLRAIGCGDFAAFICKPADWKETAEKFKTAERARLVAAGYTIVANIGDQDSDLAGGYAEKTFKLPNPFYRSR